MEFFQAIMDLGNTLRVSSAADFWEQLIWDELQLAFGELSSGKSFVYMGVLTLSWVSFRCREVSGGTLKVVEDLQNMKQPVTVEKGTPPEVIRLLNKNPSARDDYPPMNC